MLYCPDCGKEVQADQSVCSHCDHQLDDTVLIDRQSVIGDSGRNLLQELLRQSGSQGGSVSSGASASVTSADSGGSTGGGILRRRYLRDVGMGMIGLGVGGGAMYAYTRRGELAVERREHENAGEAAWIDRQNTPSGTEGTVELDEGEYTAVPIELDGNSTLVVEVENVRSGVLDVWTVPDAEFDGFRNGDSARFVADLSQSGVTGGTVLTSTVPQDTYWICLGNTAVYGTSPEGSVEADVVITRESN